MLGADCGHSFARMSQKDIAIFRFDESVPEYYQRKEWKIIRTDGCVLYLIWEDPSGKGRKVKVTWNTNTKDLYRYSEIAKE